jgi:MFS-type transporter involved in bile tolerance (Atg22 family)
VTGAGRRKWRDNQRISHLSLCTGKLDSWAVLLLVVVIVAAFQEKIITQFI